MREIPLTHGKVALVDDSDHEWLAQKKWCYYKSSQYTGYAVSSDCSGGRRKLLYMHREIVKPGTGLEVDHINHDGLDNRRANLRAVTHSENLLNQRGRKTKQSRPAGQCYIRVLEKNNLTVYLLEREASQM